MEMKGKEYGKSSVVSVNGYFRNVLRNSSKAKKSLVFIVQFFQIIMRKMGQVFITFNRPNFVRLSGVVGKSGATVARHVMVVTFGESENVIIR